MKQRIVRVSSFFLEMFLRGELRGARASTAPKDLKIVAIYPDQPLGDGGPITCYHFVVESASFAALPDGSDPFIEPTYFTDVKAVGRLTRWFRRFRAAWRAA